MDILRSLPLGLYLEQPITGLHRLDPRVKLVWLMGFLLTPVLASDLWRIALVFLLVALTWWLGFRGGCGGSSWAGFRPCVC